MNSFTSDDNVVGVFIYLLYEYQVDTLTHDLANIYIILIELFEN